MAGKSQKVAPGRRVAIVKGLRTPFLEQGTGFGKLSALDLARIVVTEIIQRADLDPELIDACVYGQVVPGLLQPGIAREVVLAAGLPRKIEALTVSRACATSIQSMTTAA